jgi:Tol biopolymer transport system component
LVHPLGSRLGVYEITARIGAGGMGEVYRATDTTLKRAVALKVLPGSVATDEERLARFQREAEVLAALNHPNIAAIYGLERSGSMTALVMELVEGEDLAERLARGPLPIDDAVVVARQMADALEAAHERGIIHRDLKPANVKVRPDGAVKVLDFGLAKPMAVDVAATVASQGPLPTITSPARLRQGFGEAGTEMGVILGTAAYMSPEQARGGAVDTRADIWAFGVVLFELLTGKPLFGGDTVSDTLASVLRQEVPFAALPASTPEPVRYLLRRCLERDPRRRLRHIGEARVLLDDSDGAFRSADAEAAPAVRPAWRRRAAVAVPWMLLLGLAVFTVWWMVTDRQSAAASVVRAVLPHAESGAITGRIAITPDGRHVVFAASRDGVSRLVVRSLDRFEHRVLAGTEGAEGPFLSPDARWVGFFVGDRMKRVPFAGGIVEDLAEVPKPLLRAAAWTTRGEIITAAAGTGPGLVRVPERGGAPVPIRDAAGTQIRGQWPIPTPDGRHLVFMQGGSGGVEDDYLHTLSLETGALQRTSIVTRDPVAILAGHVFFRREDGALTAVRFDDARGQIAGDPFQVLEPSTSVAISATGTAVYFADDGLARLTLRERERSQTVWQPPWPVRDPHASPDGTAIVLVRDVPPVEVWLYDLATATPTRIAAQATRPAWSQDRRRIVYLRAVAGLQPMRQVLMRPADASAAETLLFRTETLRVHEARLTPDGRDLLLNVQGETSGLVRVPLSGEQTLVPVIADEPGLLHVRLSPDGAWVAYTSTSSGTQEVYARPLSGGGTRVTVSAGGGNEPVWRPDGRGIYYRSGDRFVLATLEGTPPLRVAKRETVLTGDFARRGRWTYDVMPDGRLLVMEPTPGSMRLVLVHGWIDEVRDRLTTSSR